MRQAPRAVLAQAQVHLEPQGPPALQGDPVPAPELVPRQVRALLPEQASDCSGCIQSELLSQQTGATY